VARVLAYPLFARIRTAFPGIRLHIFESESGYLAELLANGRLDLAVLFRDVETRGICVQPLWDEDLYVFGHIGLKLAPLADICPMQDLDGTPMVLNSAPQGLRLLIDRSFARAGLELNVVAEIDSLSTIMSIVQEGSACTILPTSVVAHKEPAQRPMIRRIVEPSIRRPIGLCWPTALPPTSARIAVCRTIVDLLEQFVNDRLLMGATLRPIDRSAFGD
jgi:LysR family nitrogen assimilation transcriptional regulator